MVGEWTLIQTTKCKAYILSYQVIDDVEFHVHCEVYNWKLSVMKELYTKLGAILNLARALGFSEVWSVSPNPKFCELYGGIDSDIKHEGCHIMYWEL